LPDRKRSALHANFFVNVRGVIDRRGDLCSQQFAVAATHTIDGHADSCWTEVLLAAHVAARDGVFAIGKIGFSQSKEFGLVCSLVFLS